MHFSSKFSLVKTGALRSSASESSRRLAPNLVGTSKVQYLSVIGISIRNKAKVCGEASFGHPMQI